DVHHITYYTWIHAMSTQSETNTALVLNTRGSPLQLTTQPIPEAVYGSAVLRVLATLVYANARSVFAGQFPTPLTTPVTPSAACIARVHATGPDATSLKEGDLVFCDLFTRSRDDPSVCHLQGYMGGHESFEKAWTHGAYARYARVPLESCWTLPETILQRYSCADLCYLGNVCIALAGLLDVHVQAGDTVIIAPATGQFGGSAVQAALALGARIIACGRNGEVLGQMKRVFGGRFETVQMVGDVAVDTEAIKALCGKGADAFVDFTPPRAAESKHMMSCIAALRENGTALIMGLVFGEASIPYADVMRKGLRVQGRCMFDRWHVEQAIKLLEIGALKVGSGEGSGIAVKTFKMNEVDQALDAAADEGVWGQMVVLEP
ncbi:hypothetical protein LTR70_010613, partial [Exophiala xenobiotica]